MAVVVVGRGLGDARGGGREGPERWLRVRGRVRFIASVFSFVCFIRIQVPMEVRRGC